MNGAAIREPYEDPQFLTRRTALQARILEPIGDLNQFLPDSTLGSVTASVHQYNAAYGARIRHYHLLLLLDIDPDAANSYYADHEDWVSHWWNHPRNEPDWKMIPLVRVYFECHRKLSHEARSKMEALMLEFRTQVAFGGTENHIINRVVLCLLCDAALGIDDEKTSSAGEVFERWIWQRGHRGYMEFNSPTYHACCVYPLFLMHDFTVNRKWKRMATAALDQIMAMIAIQSLNGVRGGPWHRATSPRDVVDGSTDVSYVASHIFFGNVPDIAATSSAWLTTRYRVPRIIYNLATSNESRGNYEVLQRVDTVDPCLDSYHYVTPRYILGCFQNGSPFTCRYYGSTNTANLQPWELTFSDPRKVLGIWRDLSEVDNKGNQNTALMQYRSTLLFRGEWLDYNNNLGELTVKSGAGWKLYCYNVETQSGSVFIAVRHYYEMGAGVLDVTTPELSGAWENFINKAASLRGCCTLNGSHFSHTTIHDDVLIYDEGLATVNNQRFSLSEYPLCKSPWVNSDWDSGKIRITDGSEELVLDFANPAVRCGRGLSAIYYSDASFRNEVFRRVDQTLDYQWKTFKPFPGADDGISVRWTGAIYVKQSASHLFIIRTSGKALLWVNDTLVAEAVSPGDQTVERCGSISLEGGRTHKIRLDFSCDRPNPLIVVSLSNPWQPRACMGLLSDLFPEIGSHEEKNSYPHRLSKPARVLPTDQVACVV